MKITKTQAEAIAHQLQVDARKQADAARLKHFNSPGVKKKTDALYDKIKGVLQLKEISVKYGADDSWNATTVTRKEHLQKAIAKDTFVEREIKPLGILIQEIIVAAISCDTVEQIMEKVKATY